MQRGYRADGWLGFILGSKLFYDFSGKYPFEDRMSGLLKALSKVSVGEETVGQPLHESVRQIEESLLFEGISPLESFNSLQLEVISLVKKFCVLL